ncbi:hypothetical protein TREMEDRAFT_59820 [Tremella mesenterica DSM 1558]|uniref:uncharacterized protein n=1 Tax=Tremella mesenterica (strain ATCC 24925 / CBS 8224 / DSM 1558 / NBRC 9311 / NRRL Y-6157 / RJB 2259-6 / UBC 559-6) TaxID=578456 RepID=UPI0003F49CF2|nr:uncharacterized protein TREMEDRAFT_59820 [Tremella mesenterica DSM 1558]EIW73647.1 hypothetical protein TREMEDRAFT_59820 [Tremella mesenterica DSM 1558]
MFKQTEDHCVRTALSHMEKFMQGTDGPLKRQFDKNYSYGEELTLVATIVRDSMQNLQNSGFGAPKEIENAISRLKDAGSCVLTWLVSNNHESNIEAGQGLSDSIQTVSAEVFKRMDNDLKTEMAILAIAPALWMQTWLSRPSGRSILPSSLPEPGPILSDLVKQKQICDAVSRLQKSIQDEESANTSILNQLSVAQGTASATLATASQMKAMMKKMENPCVTNYVVTPRLLHQQ